MTECRSLALVTAGCMVMIWLVASALSRGHGVYPFAAGLAALVLALAAFRSGHRALLYGLAYLLILASTLTLAFEALLHVWPGVLRGNLANVAYSGYHWHRAGVYRLDPHRAIVLRPSVARWMYWNGHWWWHETNEDGYRGARLARADVVLLGDSMIYGHGVNEADTVAARLAARTGLAVANLGQHATGPLQSLLTLRAHGRRLLPKTVLMCFHFSDGNDSLVYYSPSELSRFLRSSGEEAPAPGARAEYWPAPAWQPSHLFADYVAMPLRCAGVLGALGRSVRVGRPRLPVTRRDPLVPTSFEINKPFAPLQTGSPADLRLCWQAQEQAATEMRRFCDSIGARLVLFDIGYPREFTSAVESLAHRLGVDYSPAGRTALRRCLAGDLVYLADDGHWTGLGAQIVADELARSLQGRFMNRPYCVG